MWITANSGVVKQGMPEESDLNKTISFYAD